MLRLDGTGSNNQDEDFLRDERMFAANNREDLAASVAENEKLEMPKPLVVTEATMLEILMPDKLLNILKP